MSSWIVAANGRLSRPIGWALPVIQTSGRCAALGAHRSFPATELERLTDEGLVTPVEPIEIEAIDEPKDAVWDPGRKVRFLERPLYLFYCHWARLAEVGVRIPEHTLRSLGALTSVAERPDLRICAIPRAGLRDYLDWLWKRLLALVVEHLARLDGGGFLPARTEEHLRLLTTCLFDLSITQPQAKQAIAVRGFFITLSPISSTLGAWLEAASRRWDLPPSLDYWSLRIRSVRETMVVRKRVYSFHPSSPEQVLAKWAENLEVRPKQARDEPTNDPLARYTIHKANGTRQWKTLKRNY